MWNVVRGSEELDGAGTANVAGVTLGWRPHPPRSVRPHRPDDEPDGANYGWRAPTSHHTIRRPAATFRAPRTMPTFRPRRSGR